MPNDKSNLRQITEQENYQIDSLKKIFTSILFQLQASKAVGMTAIAELLLFSLAETATSEEHYKELVNKYVNEYFIPAAHNTAKSTLELYKLLRENPNVLSELTDRFLNNDNVKVFVQDKEDQEQPKAPTKH